jgi:hypothetical protein
MRGAAAYQAFEAALAEARLEPGGPQPAAVPRADAGVRP